jgi:SdpC family antimicrobial peptide
MHKARFVDRSIELRPHANSARSFVRPRICGALLLCVLMQPVGCSSAETGSEPPVVGLQSQVSALSGQDFFRGFFFGQGAVAGMLPELWSEPVLRAAAQRYLRAPGAAQEMERALLKQRLADPTNVAENRAKAEAELRAFANGETTLASSETLEKLASAVIGDITKKDAAFFSRFESEMKSGNPQRVSTSLDGAYAKLSSTLEELGVVAGDNGPPTSTSCGLNVVCVVNVAFAVNAVAVAFGGVAIALAVYFYVTVAEQPYSVPSTTGGKPSLQRDKFMLDLAERFASAPTH